jgi:metal-sulfur cluster biosynthetic enzyme
MTVTAVSLESEILAALDTVADPELDQPSPNWDSCDQ